MLDTVASYVESPARSEVPLRPRRVGLRPALCGLQPAGNPAASKIARPISGFRHRLLALIVVFLSGCRVGPDYSRPSVTTPAVFRGAQPPPSPASLADLKWFEVFRDSQLQELVRRAFEGNYDLRDAVQRVEVARANLGITRADQFPNLTADANLTFLRISRGGEFPFPINRIFGTLALNLLTYEVDVWGRLRRATEAARADLLAAEETRKAVITTLVSDVATEYLNLIELDAEMEIAKRTLAARQEQLNLIRARERGGVATALDLRQAEQLVYGAEQTIPEIERLMGQTENAICFLLGVNPGPIPRGRRLTEQEQPVSIPPGLPSALLERRPDILAAEQNLVAANARIGVARAAYFPLISLTGFLGVQSDQLTSLFSRQSQVWEFVPQITQPIFTAGRIRSGVRLSEAQQQIALIQYERVIQTAFREVSDALIQHRKIREVLEKQALLVAAVRERARLAYMRYTGGVDTLLNALDADRDLFVAELLQAQNQRDELLAVVQLYKALGGGW